MGKSLLKEISYDELIGMRDNGMTNQDIANALGISISTVYRHIGAQPASMRKKYSARYDVVPQTAPEREEFVEAALVVEDRSISLAGLFAGYKINMKAKEVTVFVEDGVDALVVPFGQVETFAKEISAISRHIDELRVGNEVW